VNATGFPSGEHRTIRACPGLDKRGYTVIALETPTTTMPNRDDTPPDVVARLEEALAALERQQRTVERLSLLVESSKTLTSTLDLCQVFDSVLTLAARHTNADRATLFLVDAERGELWSLVAQGIGHREIRLPIGHGLAGWVAKNGQTLSLPDAHKDARFDPRFDESLGYRTGSILVMPVRGRDGRIIGVLELLNKPSGPFSVADIQLMDGFTVHSAIALENARLHRNSLERLCVEQELALARSIHEKLLPHEPQIEGFDTAVTRATCSRVGGDYYDFLPLSRGHLFVIADVEGRGTRAALGAATVRTALHALAGSVRSLEQIAEQLNASVVDGGGGCASVFLGILDLPGRRVHYINAGHPPPVVVGPKGASVLREGGTLMGVLPEARFERGSRRLDPGEVLLAYTDGITEATGLGGREYGIERLLMTASSRSGESAREIVDAITVDVETHASCNGSLDEDDRLLVAIRPA
jgi:sigma-B regulation protein RsbU (phosphoserine phosphatase)